MKFFDGDVYTATFASGYTWCYERNNGTWTGTFGSQVRASPVLDGDIERSITTMMNDKIGGERFTFTRGQNE